MVIEFAREAVLNNLFEDRHEGGDEVFVGNWIGNDHGMKEDQGGCHHGWIYGRGVRRLRGMETSIA